MKKLIILTTAIIAVAASAFATGFASTSTAATLQKENMLQQAGFRTKTVTTPKQQQRVNGLPAGKVSAVTYKGQLYYVYPTGKKDQIYVGKQSQYDAYKQIKQKAMMAQEGQQQRAGYVDMTEETAGPRHIQVREFDGFGPLGGDTR